MLESRLAYQNPIIEIWTSIDPGIFRRPDDRRIRNVTYSSPNLVLVNSDGDYDRTNVGDMAFYLSEVEPEVFFPFRVEDIVFYKKTGDYVRGEQSEYLMRISSLRELCNQLWIRGQEGLPGGCAALVVFDPRRGYSIAINAGL